MDQQAKQQIAERLKTANHILVSVSTNPSVDQLAALIGFTLLLNKMGKHGTAVFSGQVPSTLEFLKPEDTLQKNTDSLRDFIIALDKAKADKLRYKVEDKVVKIFITPYRTSLSEKDLDFSQGDFNVDAVVALGVKEQKDLDEAIVAHGRILHDATVMSINTDTKGNLGTINWNEPDYSSLCELLFGLGEELGPNLYDAQMATAFLTGIVAETKRFSNDKTSPHTMTVAARLMGLGANQQLIATKLDKEATPEAPKPPLEKPKPEPPKKEVKKPLPVEKKAEPEVKKPSDGSLKIDHTPPPPAPLSDEANDDQIDIDYKGTLSYKAEEARKAEEAKKAENDKKKDEEPSRLALDPPSMGGQLTANSEPERYDPSTDPMTLPQVAPPLLSRKDPTPTLNEALSGTEDEEIKPVEPVPDPQDARSAVNEALKSGPVQALEPIEALNAQPVDLSSEPASSTPPSPAPEPAAAPVPPAMPFQPPTVTIPAPVPPATPVLQPFIPPSISLPPTPMAPPTNTSGPATPPPPVPPPMMPPAFGTPNTDDDTVTTPPLAPL